MAAPGDPSSPFPGVPRAPPAAAGAPQRAVEPCGGSKWQTLPIPVCTAGRVLGSPEPFFGGVEGVWGCAVMFYNLPLPCKERGG